MSEMVRNLLTGIRLHGSVILVVLCATGIAGLALLHSSALRMTAGGIVMQRSSNDCAPAAVAMALADLGQSVPYTDVAEKFKLSNEGATVSDVIAVLAAFGIRSHAWKMNSTTLAACARPSILHMRKSHFVVLDSIRDGTVFLRDPARGWREQMVAEFEKEWAGIVIVIKQEFPTP